VYLPVDKVRFTKGKDQIKVRRLVSPTTPGSAKLMHRQSYHYLSNARNFCQNCGIHMTVTLINPNHEMAGNLAVNVRTFLDVDYDKIKVLWVDMKDEDPQYEPDAVSESK
jgi:hypothetical protein